MPASPGVGWNVKVLPVDRLQQLQRALGRARASSPMAYAPPSIGAHVLSNSWGRSSNAINAAIDYAGQQPVVVFAAETTRPRELSREPLG
jgi:hypothetical protein